MPKLNKTEMKIVAKRIAGAISDKEHADRKAAEEAMDESNLKKAEGILKEFKSLSLCARKMAFGKKYNSTKLDVPELSTIQRKLRKCKDLPDPRSQWQIEEEVLDELIICNSSGEDRDALISIVSRKFGLAV